MVVALAGRELLRHPVHRGRRGGDQLGDVVLRGGLHDVERAVHQDLEGEPWLLGALGDPDGCLVEDQVLARGQVVDQVALDDVTLDQLDATGGQRVVEIGAPAADQVVEHVHVRGTGGE